MTKKPEPLMKTMAGYVASDPNKVLVYLQADGMPFPLRWFVGNQKETLAETYGKAVARAVGCSFKWEGS